MIAQTIAQILMYDLYTNFTCFKDSIVSEPLYESFSLHLSSMIRNLSLRQIGMLL